LIIHFQGFLKIEEKRNFQEMSRSDHAKRVAVAPTISMEIADEGF